MKNPNWNSISLKPGERLDELQRNGYVIIQDQERFCFGMDAVLLSGFARVKDGGSVLDMGTGTGIIPILLEAKTNASHLTGLEIQPDSAGHGQAQCGAERPGGENLHCGRGY